MSYDYEADFHAWCVRRKAEQLERRRRRALVMRRVRVIDPLPMARVWLRGPRWSRGLTKEILPAIEGRPLASRRRLVYDFADDVRELVCERIQFNRVAMWADPREWL